MQDWTHREPPTPWALRQFSTIGLGDQRLVKRVVKIAEHLASEPGKSIPRLFNSWGDVKGAYRLFDHPKSQPATLQRGHRQLVEERISTAGVYLLLEDTSEFSWAGNEPVEGLGPIGSGKKGLQGFHLHTVLAVQWPQGDFVLPAAAAHRPAVDVVGVLTQEYYLRTALSEQEKKEPARSKLRERESQLWERASEHIGPAAESAHWIRVCDRGADVYEFLLSCQTLGHDFVIRACQNRGLVDPTNGQPCGRLFSTARSNPSLGTFKLQLRARKNRPARTATLHLSVGSVSLRSPQRPGGFQGSSPAIACTVVRVWEPEDSDAAEPLEWILLCRRSVSHFQQALECALQYSTRWLIEEYHKCLKTGLGAERLQLREAHKLFAAVAVMSVVAVRLLVLRELSRASPEAPASACGLETTELEVLQAKCSHPLLTVKDVVLAIGRLGGHLGRRGDGMPGWLALWRGMNDLRNMAEGFRLARQVPTPSDYG